MDYVWLAYTVGVFLALLRELPEVDLWAEEGDDDAA